MLTKQQIVKSIQAGQLRISPFTQDQLGPNSYDVRLGNKISIPQLNGNNGAHIDPFLEMGLKTYELPDDGMVIYPGQLYLANTIESTTSSHYVPVLEGKSSLARCGLSIHLTAGIGDLGWGFIRDQDGKVVHTDPTWTLEMTTIYPFLIRPGMLIGQVMFHVPYGEIDWYSGKYNFQKDPQGSLYHKNYEGDHGKQ